ncbi:hypothetical protein SAMN02745751_03178 [Dethiosulfatibacter aminovorans DSM 17477]|uniref:Uncharacterized protein n=1 Tax=Dethiosulfatibacter aminovorans DSM 17477 TaxID=1121476 RepID=A0A1M6LHJ5_9FIRM|nr:hypothetical protein [Dethiosulfatibacter aminovorans]SHJ70682.1 hypothetical protein SAMN02745751_03178 [Dethiosulfatibacter aminovorans DSM 17477]
MRGVEVTLDRKTLKVKKIGEVELQSEPDKRIDKVLVEMTIQRLKSLDAEQLKKLKK